MYLLHQHEQAHILQLKDDTDFSPAFFFRLLFEKNTTPILLVGGTGSDVRLHLQKHLAIKSSVNTESVTIDRYNEFKITSVK